MAKTRHGIGLKLEAFSEAVRRWAGSSNAFLTAVSIIAVWALVGPMFNYSDRWQLMINTGTTIGTFLMVFLIQRSQNKDALAIHVKLNELVAAMEGASNRVIDVEGLSEKDLATLECYYQELARLAGKEADVARSHSVEEAKTRHSLKRSRR